MKRLDIHPRWCGQGHVCSYDRPAGEHRSNPVTVDTDHARLVATRIRTRAGSDRIELRAVLDLPTDPDAARVMADQFVARLHYTLAGTRGAGGAR